MDEISKKYLNNFKVYLNAERNFSNYTQKAYAADVLGFLIWLNNFDIKKVNLSKVREYLLFIQKFNYSKTTIARKIASLRAFYRYLYRERIVEANPIDGVSSPKKGQPLPKFLTEDEINSILDNMKIDTPGAFRNKVIIELLNATGMRISELSGLNFENLNIGQNEITVFGKGAKERIVLIPDRVKELLHSYINNVRPLICPKPDKDALFINVYGKRLQNQSVRKAINEVVENINLPKHVTPHVFRHSFATKMLENGVDLRIVQELLGHASISNTQIYTHVSTQRLKMVYNATHPRA